MFGLLTGLFSAVGTGLSIFGGMKADAGKKEQSKALLAEDAARHKQMILDAQRTTLDTVRGAIITRSLALAAGANQGAQYGSGVRSGVGGAANKAAYQLEQGQQNLSIGEDIFAARKDYYKAGGQVQSGEALANLGGTIGGMAPTLGQLGTYAFGKLQTATQSTPPVSASNTSTSSLYSLGTIY